jgi:hypothetical protein
MDETLVRMTKDQLVARRHEDEMRMAELDPQKGGNSQDQGTGIAQRHSRYLNEYQNLEAEVAAIDSLLKNM